MLGVRTRALAVPWRACLWFLRNLGSVPLREGYLEVLGFLILQYYLELALRSFCSARSAFDSSYPFRCALRDWLC